MLADALREGTSKRFVASGSGSWVRGQLPNDVIAIDTTGFDQVIEHAADDMTITLGPGTRWSALQEQLATAGQELPIETNDQEATIGGLLSRNYLGPRSWSAGKWRDRVLGIEAVDSRGRTFRSGGRVVKNVAGYDLTKAAIGAFGTLGVITEMTLKVQPIIRRAAYEFAFESPKQIQPLWTAAVRGQLALSSLEVCFSDSRWSANVSVEGDNGCQSDQRLRDFTSSLGLQLDEKSQSNGGIAAAISDDAYIASVSLSQWLSLAEDATKLGGTVRGWLGGTIVWMPSEHTVEEQRRQFEESVRSCDGWLRLWNARSKSTALSQVVPNTTVSPSDRLMKSLRQQLDPDGKFYDFGFPWAQVQT